MQLIRNLSTFLLLSGCVYSSSAVEWFSSCDGGVFRSDDSISISFGGSRCVDWSQGCDTLIAPTYSPAAEYTSLRCHGNRRHQNTQTGSSGTCCRSLSLDSVYRILSLSGYV